MASVPQLKGLLCLLLLPFLVTCWLCCRGEWVLWCLHKMWVINIWFSSCFLCFHLRVKMLLIFHSVVSALLPMFFRDPFEARLRKSSTRKWNISPFFFCFYRIRNMENRHVIQSLLKANEIVGQATINPNWWWTKEARRVLWCTWEAFLNIGLVVVAIFGGLF